MDITNILSHLESHGGKSRAQCLIGALHVARALDQTIGRRVEHEPWRTRGRGERIVREVGRHRQVLGARRRLEQIRCRYQLGVGEARGRGADHALSRRHAEGIALGARGVGVGGQHVRAIADVAAVVVKDHLLPERVVEGQVRVVGRHQRASEMEVVDVVAAGVAQEAPEVPGVPRDHRPRVVRAHLIRGVLREARVVRQRVRVDAEVAECLRQDRSLSRDLRGRMKDAQTHGFPCGQGAASK